MMTMRIGQRVRLAWKTNGSTSTTPVGAEGRISAIGPFRIGDLSYRLRGFARPADCMVEWDRGDHSAALFAQLEPIVPGGHRPAELTIEELLPNIRTGETA